jgi:alpha-tubulin suppressor-like RCC1 family protein
MLVFIFAGCTQAQPAQNSNAAAVTAQSSASASPSIKVVSVDTSYTSSAAVTDTGDLYIWGDGQTLPVKKMAGVKAVSLGWDFCMALKENGELYAWGNNAFGQIGNGGSAAAMLYEPEPVKVMAQVRAISAGQSHALAVTEAGDLYVWGGNELGQVGNGKANIGGGNANAENIQATPVKIMSGVKMADAGMENTAAVTESGDLFVWGFNDYGQVGNGEYRKDANGGNIGVTKPLKIMEGVKAISMGYHCAAALKENGELYMWGNNEYGLLGDGTKGDGNYETMDAIVPAPVKVEVPFSTAAPGPVNAAIDKDGNLLLWGINEYGSIGNGAHGDGDTMTLDAVVAAPYQAMADVAAASAYTQTLAVTKNGELYAWGNNELGQLGNGKKGDGDNSTMDCYETAPVKITLDPNTKAEAVEKAKAFEAEASDITLNGYPKSGGAVADHGIVYLADFTVLKKIDVQNRSVEDIALKYSAHRLLGVSGGYIYFLDDQKLVRMKTDGSGSELLYEAKGEDKLLSNTCMNSKYLYYSAIVVSEENKSSAHKALRVFCYDLQTGQTTVMAKMGQPNAIDETGLYRVVGTKIGKVGFDGSTPTMLADTKKEIQKLLVSGGWLYFTVEAEGNQLYKIKTDGKELQKVGAIQTEYFNVAGKTVFYADSASGGKLYSTDTEGAGSKMIVDKQVYTIDICAGRVFFRISGAGNYASVLPDGSNLIEIK